METFYGYPINDITERIALQLHSCPRKFTILPNYGYRWEEQFDCDFCRDRVEVPEWVAKAYERHQLLQYRLMRPERYQPKKSYRFRHDFRNRIAKKDGNPYGHLPKKIRHPRPEWPCSAKDVSDPHFGTEARARTRGQAKAKAIDEWRQEVWEDELLLQEKHEEELRREREEHDAMNAEWDAWDRWNDDLEPQEPEPSDDPYWYEEGWDWDGPDEPAYGSEAWYDNLHETINLLENHWLTYREVAAMEAGRTQLREETFAWDEAYERDARRFAEWVKAVPVEFAKPWDPYGWEEFRADMDEYLAERCDRDPGPWDVLEERIRQELPPSQSKPKRVNGYKVLGYKVLVRQDARRN